MNQPLLTPSQAMLEDKNLCTRIAQAYEEIDSVIAQLQQNAVTEENMATIGPVIFAMGQIKTAFFRLKQVGDPIVEKMKAQQNNTNA